MYNTLKPLLTSVSSFQISQQKKVIASDINEKSLNQLVSYVDIESEKMLVEGLLKITPNAGFITEEGTTDQHKSDQYWIIDPLDGTTNYLFGHRQYSISIALVEDGKTTIGAIYIPMDNELYFADESGACLNGEKISVSPRTNLIDTLIATGFPYYSFDEMESYLSVLKILMQETKGLRRIGSAAIDLAYTACGKFDGFFELNLSPWDVAAGAYIVQQAGGRVTDFTEGDNYIFGNSILAGTVSAHAQLLEIIRKYPF
ncbi:MAG: hypothetical protein RLZZ337_1513, partial [Bacteroidota bacterium]|jgi:myo-inositol-1(or 4)-monophosphatase